MKYKRLIKSHLVFSLLILTVGVIFLTSNCSEDKTLYRATSDYFPLKTGMIWHYLNSADTTDTCVVKVIGDTSAYGQPSILVNRGSHEEYWIKDKTEIRKLVEIKINRAGYDFILEQQYRSYFQLPLIEGNSWRDDFTNTTDVFGESMIFRHIITGKVDTIEDIFTPAGDFYEVYQLTLIDTIHCGDSLSTTTSYYWLAPEVGVVKQRFENEDTLEQIIVQHITNQ